MSLPVTALSQKSNCPTIGVKRKNELRISQPIHHQQNINGTRSVSHPANADHLYSPNRKRPRLHLSPPTSISCSDLTKIPKKKMHPMSLPRPSHTQPSTNHSYGKISKSDTNASLRMAPPSGAPRERVSVAQINGYHPTHLYSSSVPLRAEEEMLESHRHESATNLINFSCIDYDSLVEYCKTFGLHRFQYQYHYDLAPKSTSNREGALSNESMVKQDGCSILDKVEVNSEAKEGDSARIHSSSSGIGGSDKREMDEDEVGRTAEMEMRGKRKRGRKSKKAMKNGSGTEHHYFNSDLLDRHYERRPRERIPKTFDASTRLTKSELVDIVREHFLSTPLLVEMNEMDVFQQFLRFILQRRNKLKKEFVVRK